MVHEDAAVGANFHAVSTGLPCAADRSGDICLSHAGRRPPHYIRLPNLYFFGTRNDRADEGLSAFVDDVLNVDVLVAAASQTPERYGQNCDGRLTGGPKGKPVLVRNRVSCTLGGRICDSVHFRSLLSVASMKRQIGYRSRSFAPALRELLTVLLTVAYVVIGVAGEISCASETLASADQVEIADAPVEASPGKTDQESKKPVTVVDHCCTCVPLLIPPPIPVADPMAKPVSPTFATPVFLLEDHPGLDTPPPKYRS